MRKIVMQKMAKIAAVSAMSAIISISFNGCWFFGSSTGNEAESCNGEGAVTIKEQVKIASSRYSSGFEYINTIAKGECKNGLKEGLWKYYDANDSSKPIQEVTFANGIRNGATKKDAKEKDDYFNKRMRNYTTIEYYNNGKKVSEIKGQVAFGYGADLYIYEDDIKTSSGKIRRERKYELPVLGFEYELNVRKIKEENEQIEWENNKMQNQARQQYEEAKAQAQEIAKQRAESKVKKPTMQEVKKSKNAMDTYRAKLKAQEEKELQIELSKIQAPQVAQKQTIEIPPYKEPNLDTYEEVLAFVKDKKYTITEFIDRYRFKVVSSQDSDGSNFGSEIKYEYGRNYYKCNITNNTYGGNVCLDLKSNDSFKEAIEKSMFKDKFNAILPNVQ